MSTAVLALVVIVAVVIVSVSSGGGTAGEHNNTNNAVARDWSYNGLAVYGSLGYEGVPLQLGPVLSPLYGGLTNQPMGGIQCNTKEQLAYHHHAHVAIFIHGKPYSVPLGIGITPPVEVANSPQGQVAVGSAAANGCFYWIHTHEQDGIVHLESPIARTFELAQFFAVWHVALTAHEIGPYTGTVTATLNGQPWTGDPGSIPLDAHAQIVLNLGSPVVVPPPIDWTSTKL